MAYTDWVFNKSTTDIIASIDIFTPVVDTGSLNVFHPTGSDLYLSTYNTTYTRGVIKGKIRTLIQPVDLTGPSTYSAGIYFMGSDDDVINTGDCYGAFYVADAGGSSTRFSIVKFTGGFSGAFNLYLGASVGLVAEGTITAMEVEWDASSGTEVDITLRRVIGSTDFGAMITETSLTDSSSPFVTSVSEGLTTHNDASSSVEWNFDNTTIFSIL